MSIEFGSCWFVLGTKEEVYHLKSKDEERVEFVTLMVTGPTSLFC